MFRTSRRFRSFSTMSLPWPRKAKPEEPPWVLLGVVVWVTASRQPSPALTSWSYTSFSLANFCCRISFLWAG